MRGDKSVLPPNAEGHPDRDVTAASAQAVSALKFPQELDFVLGTASLLLMGVRLGELGVAAPAWLQEQLSAAADACTHLQACTLSQLSSAAAATALPHSDELDNIQHSLSALGAVAGAVKPAPRKGGGAAKKQARGASGQPATLSCGLTRRLANDMQNGMSAQAVAAALASADVSSIPALQLLFSDIAQIGYKPAADGPFLNWEPATATRASPDALQKAASAALAALSHSASGGGAAGAEPPLPWDAALSAAKAAAVAAARHKQETFNRANPGTFSSSPQPLPVPTNSKRVRVSDPPEPGAGGGGGELWLSEEDTDSDSTPPDDKTMEARQKKFQSQQDVHGLLSGGLNGDGYQGEVVRGLAAREAEWKKGGRQGPCHRMTVRMARPAYSKQAHECYTRFNVSVRCS